MSELKYVQVPTYNVRVVPQIYFFRSGLLTGCASLLKMSVREAAIPDVSINLVKNSLPSVLRNKNS